MKQLKEEKIKEERIIQFAENNNQSDDYQKQIHNKNFQQKNLSQQKKTFDLSKKKDLAKNRISKHIIKMSLMNSIIYIFKIVIPAYYSLKYLKKRNQQQITNILKFWCLNSIWTIFEALIPLVVDQWFFFIVNISFYIAMTFPEYKRSEMIFDNTISKLYLKNQDVISSYAEKIEAQFDSATGSATSKIKDVLSISVFPIFEKTVKKALFSFNKKSITAEETPSSETKQE